MSNLQTYLLQLPVNLCLQPYILPFLLMILAVPWHDVSNLKPPPPPPPPAELETPSSSQLKKPPPPPPESVQRDMDQGDMVTKKMPPTAKKRRGDSVARSSKKQKVSPSSGRKTKAPEEAEEGSYPRRRHPLHRWYFSEVT